MTEAYATIVFLFVLFTLLGSSIWIGLALMGVAWVGMEMFTVRPAGDAMITTIWTSSSSWTLTALPLFIWMGEILYRTRLSQDMFRGLAPWMRWLAGRIVAHKYRGLHDLRGCFRIFRRDADDGWQNVDPRAARAWIS